MNEVLSLFAVLFIVYALQCISASPPGTVVFLVNSRLRGRLIQHRLQLGHPQFRLFLFNPFFPLSNAVYTDSFPFSFLAGPTGALSGVDFIGCPSSPTAVDHVTFDVHHKFASRAKRLFVDDSLVATLHSERSASELAVFLDHLQSAQPLRRPTLLESELRRRFALDTIKERLELFSRCTEFLKSMCLSLYVFLFVIAPAVIYVRGLQKVWPILVFFLALYLFLILWAFRRAQRRLYPRREERDLQSFLAIALSPFAAIRAVDPLAAGLLGNYHPIAVACALLSAEDFVQFAGREFRKIKFATHDTILENAISTFLLTQNIDPRLLLKPPAPNDAYSRTYCPVCLTQYVLEEGTCSDCDGVPLKPLA